MHVITNVTACYFYSELWNYNINFWHTRRAIMKLKCFSNTTFLFYTYLFIQWYNWLSVYNLLYSLCACTWYGPRIIIALLSVEFYHCDVTFTMQERWGTVGVFDFPHILILYQYSNVFEAKWICWIGHLK